MGADVRVALDAMGGDRAPEETVKGACQAIARDPELEVVLVGARDRIAEALNRNGGTDQRLIIQDASQVVQSDELPVDAVRRKPDSSIRVAVNLLAQGAADALVSAGNTGAVVAAGTLGCKLLPGVRRAGIAVTLPVRHGRHAILCDAGANITCKPLHLYQYGIMASRFAERVFGQPNPRVGLINIGSEETKGTNLVKETAELFSRSNLNYIGHIEGNDIFGGRVDVVVCEGFVGNVILKVAEGLFEAIYEGFNEVAKKMAPANGTTDQSVSDFMVRCKHHMDWAEYGGAPLLGVNGLVLISHGRSDAKAIHNALLLAAREHRSRLLSEMAEDVRAVTVKRESQ